MRTYYTTNVSVYYDFGSVRPTSLCATTLKELRAAMKAFIHEETKGTIGKVEAITFTPVTETVSKEITKLGYVFKTGKITNKYIKNTNLSDYYNPITE